MQSQASVGPQEADARHEGTFTTVRLSDSLHDTLRTFESSPGGNLSLWTSTSEFHTVRAAGVDRGVGGGPAAALAFSRPTLNPEP